MTKNEIINDIYNHLLQCSNYGISEVSKRADFCQRWKGTIYEKDRELTGITADIFFKKEMFDYKKSVAIKILEGTETIEKVYDYLYEALFHEIYVCLIFANPIKRTKLVKWVEFVSGGYVLVYDNGKLLKQRISAKTNKIEQIVDKNFYLESSFTCKRFTPNFPRHYFFVNEPPTGSYNYSYKGLTLPTAFRIFTCRHKVGEIENWIEVPKVPKVYTKPQIYDNEKLQFAIQNNQLDSAIEQIYKIVDALITFNPNTGSYRHCRQFPYLEVEDLRQECVISVFEKIQSEQLNKYSSNIGSYIVGAVNIKLNNLILQEHRRNDNVKLQSFDETEEYEFANESYNPIYQVLYDEAVKEQQQLQAKQEKRRIENSKKSVQVYQYDKQGNLINAFLSIKQASEETGIERTNISKCINGKRKSAGGFVFKEM